MCSTCPECPERYVRGVVLSRFEGAGELIRFWMTAFSLPPTSRSTRCCASTWTTIRRRACRCRWRPWWSGSAGEMLRALRARGSRTASPGATRWCSARSWWSRSTGSGPFDLYYHQSEALLSNEPRVAGSARLAARDAAIASTTGANVPPPLGAAHTVVLAPGSRTQIVTAGTERPCHAGQRARGLAGRPVPIWLRLNRRRDDRAAAAARRVRRQLGSRPRPYAGARPRARAARLSIPFAEASVWTLENRGTTSVTLTLALRHLGRPRRGRAAAAYPAERDRGRRPRASPSRRSRARGGWPGSACCSRVTPTRPSPTRSTSSRATSGSRSMACAPTAPAPKTTWTRPSTSWAALSRHRSRPPGAISSQGALGGGSRAAAGTCRTTWWRLRAQLKLKSSRSEPRPALLERYRSVAYVYR